MVFENEMHGRTRVNGLLAATTKTQREVQSFGKVAEMVGKPGSKPRHDEKLGERVRLLSPHLLAEWTSFLKVLNGEIGPVVADSYSAFTCRAFHDLHSTLSLLFKICQPLYL